jgi:hypothetical protein
MGSSLSSPELLVAKLEDLQRRAQVLHGDATDRSSRAKLRALSRQIRQISATLAASPGMLTRVIACELSEAALELLEQLERGVHRRLRDAL